MTNDIPDFSFNKWRKLLGLDQKDFDEIKKYLLKIKFKTGEKLYDFNEESKGIIFIISGSMRLIGLDEFDEIITIEKYKSHEIAGGVPILQDIQEFALAAASPVTGFFLSSKNFLKLVIKINKFNEYFERITIQEYFSLFKKFNPKTLTIKELLFFAKKEFLKENKIKLFKSGVHSLQESDTKFLVSSKNIKNKFYGSIIKPNELFEVVGNLEARLVKYPEEWPGLDISSKEIQLENVDITLEVNSNKEKIKSLESLEDIYGRLDKKKYPIYKGIGIINETLACLRMTSLFYEVPFKKDLIKKVIEDQLSRSKIQNLNIYQIAGIIDLMGLKTSIIKPDSIDLLHRIPLPAIVFFEKRPVIIWKKISKNFLVSDPKVGKKLIEIKKLLYRNEKFSTILNFNNVIYSPKARFDLGWFLPYIKKYKFSLFLVVLSSFFVQLLALFNPLLIQQIIDAVINQGSLRSLNILGFLLIIMALAQGILGTLRTYLFSDTTNRIDISLGKNIIRHLFRLPLNYFINRPVGEVSSRLGELEKIRNFLTGTALTIFLDGIFSIIYIAVMLKYSVKLTIWSLSVIPLVMLLTWLVSPIIRRQLKEQAEANAKVNSHLVENIAGIETIKGQGIERQSEWRWENLYGKQIEAGFRNILTSTTAGSISNFLQQISGLIVIWVGASLVLQGKLSIGQLIAFRILSSYVTNPLLRISSIWQNFQEISISLYRLSDIIEQKNEIEITGKNLPPLPPIKGNISFEKIKFAFNNVKGNQLNNINFKCKKGSFIGVIGTSGSGKSTLLKLLMRYYEPTSGKIKIDNYDISKFDLYSIRSQIGIVSQESLLFDGTIQSNISISKPHATFEDILQASKLACADEFIENLSEGYNTHISEKGAELSGGQRQRIAIARMLITNPNLVILDEATSALDIDTEIRVIKNILDFCYSRTIFFISHRINSLKNADQIIVLHEGNIAEQGNHNDLIKLNGRYSTFIKQQNK